MPKREYQSLHGSSIQHLSDEELFHNKTETKPNSKYDCVEVL